MNKKQLTKEQVERLSLANAKSIVNGTSKLKSWGKSGYYKFKSTGRWLHYRSTLELSVYRKLDESGVIKDIEGEILIIPYTFKGATLNYIPDIIVKTSSNRVYVLEVKPSDQLTEEKNVAKWDKASEFCFAKGAKFIVITENNLEQVKDLVF